MSRISAYLFKIEPFTKLKNCHLTVYCNIFANEIHQMHFGGE